MKRAKYCKVEVTGLLLFVTLFLLFCPSVLTSQEKKPRLTLRITIEREVIKVKDGKEIVEREPVEKTKIGDVLVYTINYRNEGKTVAKNATITDPIPEGTVYVADSAVGKGTQILYSIDKGKTFKKPPLKYKAKKPDGTEEEKIAPVEMFTNIRWLIKKDLPRGKGGTVSFKVKVK